MGAHVLGSATLPSNATRKIFPSLYLRPKRLSLITLGLQRLLECAKGGSIDSSRLNLGAGGVDAVREGNRPPEKTTVRCPLCGKPTGLRLGAGDAIAYCRHCPVEIHVSIRVMEEEGKEQVRA